MVLSKRTAYKLQDRIQNRAGPHSWLWSVDHLDMIVLCTSNMDHAVLTVSSNGMERPTVSTNRDWLTELIWIATGPTEATASCWKKWRLAATDMCPCDKCQMMSHIVNSCPQSKLEGGWGDCTQLRSFLLNDWRHTARKCTWQQQYLSQGFTSQQTHNRSFGDVLDSQSLRILL